MFSKDNNFVLSEFDEPVQVLSKSFNSSTKKLIPAFSYQPIKLQNTNEHKTVRPNNVKCVATESKMTKSSTKTSGNNNLKYSSENKFDNNISGASKSYYNSAASENFLNYSISPNCCTKESTSIGNFTTYTQSCSDYNQTLSSENIRSITNPVFMFPEAVINKSKVINNHETSQESEVEINASTHENQPFFFVRPHFKNNEVSDSNQGHVLLDAVALKNSTELVDESQLLSLKRKRNVHLSQLNLDKCLETQSVAERGRTDFVKRKITPSKRSLSLNKIKKLSSVKSINNIFNRPAFSFNLHLFHSLKQKVSLQKLVNEIVENDTKSLANDDFVFPKNISSFDFKMQELIFDINSYQEAVGKSCKKYEKFVEHKSQRNQFYKKSNSEDRNTACADLNNYYEDLLAHYGQSL
ncbi:hypothetical protein QEN19_001504 [Hanseniaspora menglaensis]